MTRKILRNEYQNDNNHLEQKVEQLTRSIESNNRNAYVR